MEKPKNLQQVRPMDMNYRLGNAGGGWCRAEANKGEKKMGQL